VPAANVEVQVSQRMRVARSLASAQVMINSVGLTVGFWAPGSPAGTWVNLHLSPRRAARASVLLQR
jgi:hypothetical protein